MVRQAADTADRAGVKQHIAILDGWRALSISAVLAGHWLPLGPTSLRLNEAVAASGMAMFFCLSGFLITYFLSADPRIKPFLIKRITRILPLAWAVMVILALVNQPDVRTIMSNLLFVSNLPPATLMAGGEHLWSLCVEMQFYATVALTVALLGRRGLYLLPFACLGVTGLRIIDGETISIVTWHRVDEILAGASVALFWVHGWGQRFFKQAPAFASPLLLVLLPLISLPALGDAAYARPYVATLAIGLSLYAFPQMLRALWTSRPAGYVAEISYALYVIHGMLGATILGGQGADKLVKYILRIPLFVATVVLSHISTRYYEAYFMKLGRRWIAK